jgi:hypothetical protein
MWVTTSCRRAVGLGVMAIVALSGAGRPTMREAVGPSTRCSARGRLYPPDAEKRTLDRRTPVGAV